MAGKNAIGLDIGSSSIKIIQLREDRKGVHLQAFEWSPVIRASNGLRLQLET